MIGELQAEELNVYVNLRCGQIIGDELYLYLGGGFTAESDPEKEWEETENKSKTLLDLL
jgi:isochorismate synthase